jgi:hypothetical protein
MEWLFEALFAPVGDILHIGPQSRLAVGRGFATNRAVMALHRVQYGGASFTAMAHVRARIFAAMGRPNTTGRPKRLYVSRRDAGYREASNIAAVEAVLEACGVSHRCRGRDEPAGDL